MLKYNLRGTSGNSQVTVSNSHEKQPELADLIQLRSTSKTIKGVRNDHLTATHQEEIARETNQS